MVLHKAVLVLLMAGALSACGPGLGPDCENDSRNAPFFASMSDEVGVPLGGANGLQLRYGFSGAGAFDSCTRNVSHEATWTSSNPEVAAIGPAYGENEATAGRLINGVSLGTATITAAYKGRSATQRVVVTNNS